MPARPLLVLAACVAVVRSAGNNIPSFAGPWLAYVDRVDYCPPEMQNEVIFSIRAGHFNPARPFDPQRIVGNITIPFHITDTWWANAFMDVWSANQWKPNAFVFRFADKACSSLRDHIPDMFDILFRNSSARPSHVGPCRVRKGLYKVDGLVDWVFPHFPIMPYGHYRFRIQFGEDNRVKSRLCDSVICTVIPKPPRPPKQ